MEPLQINIDGLVLDLTEYTPISLPSAWSNRALTGIDFVIRTGRRNEIEHLKALFNRKQVEVREPLAGRMYEATFTKKVERHTDQSSTRHYDVELRELDTVPTLEAIEVNGDVWPVLQYDVSKGINSHHIHSSVVRLTPEQFQSFQAVYARRDLLHVKRVGLDDVAHVYRFGSPTYWSQHTEDGTTYYKQALTFLSPEVPLSNLDFAPYYPQMALIQMLQETTARLEALVTLLHQQGVITAAQQTHLLQTQWNDLVNTDRANELAHAFRRVDDVEEAVQRS